MTRRGAALLLIALGAALGVVLATVGPKPPAAAENLQTIEWLDTPRSLRPFRLDGVAGAFDNNSLLGRWTIVLFGFLECPDVCPTSLAEMAAAADRLDGLAAGPEVAYVFVSVDPGRDAVADVSRYARFFDSSFLGVTGESAQLSQFARDLGARFEVSAGSDDYTVAHSVTFSIIDPDGVLRGRFRPGFDTASLVRDFAAVAMVRPSGA